MCSIFPNLYKYNVVGLFAYQRIVGMIEVTTDKILS